MSCPKYQQGLAFHPVSPPKHVDSFFCKHSSIIYWLGMSKENSHVSVFYSEIFHFDKLSKYKCKYDDFINQQVSILSQCLINTIMNRFMLCQLTMMCSFAYNNVYFLATFPRYWPRQQKLNNMRQQFLL